jgi:PKD repeat protein
MRILLATLFTFWSCLLVGQIGPCDQVQAGFSAQVNGAVVQFSNTTIGTGDGTLFFWNFGDGITSQDPQPTHDYGLYGTYEVCLTVVTIVEGPNGQPITCDDDYCQLVQAGPVPICSPNFLVAMDAQPQGNGLVTFIATSTFLNTNFIWYFGDGSQAYGPAANHQYAQDGTYGVCVTGWYYNEASQDTCWIEDCEPVEVSGTPCNGLEACFVTNDLGDGMYFFDNCSAQGGSAQYFWDFGDGTSSTVVNAEHLYEMPGVYSVCLVVYEGNCVDSTCTTITIAGPCNSLAANFGWSLAGAQAEFDNVTVPVGLSTTWLWNFGDGSSSTENSPSHLYTAPGTYQACLTATSLLEGGYLCTDTYCVTVVVQGGSLCQTLQADFGAFTQGLGVELVNSSFGLGFQTSYFWTFGDGQSSTAPSPSHVYDVPGTYQVCLTVISLYTSPGGTITCQDIYCAPVVILGDQPCDPNFAVELAWNAGPNNTVFLTGGSNRPNTNFIWYLGDGSEAYGSSVSHTYGESGNYTVCLAGWYLNEVTSDSCWTEDCAIITVGGGNPCEPLQACFEPLPLPNNIIYFENCSTAPEGATYFWDFGDGDTFTGPLIEHVYQPGTYTACLVVTWENCVDSTCATITVGGGEFCDGLQACFQPEPFENGAFFFSNCSQSLPIAIPVSYFWNFGDGSTSTNPQPDHAFAPGTYTVCLTVTQGDCVDTTCVAITVGGGSPCDQHQADFTTTSDGLAIQFTSTSTGTGPNTEYLWSFGDGSVAGGANPVHDYAVQGVYEVCLIISTVWEAFPGQPVVFCQDSVCYTVDVGFNDFCDQLQACFLPLPFENGAFLFENCSQVLPIDIPWQAFWDFGDGATSTEWAPAHAFAPGIYSVCLTVVHGECVDTTCTTITVTGGPGCDPDYTASFTYTVQNNVVVFQANFDTPTLGVVWTFPGGDQAYEPVHTHLFEPPGPFEVCLSTWYWSEQTQDSCWAHTCQLIDPFNTTTAVDENSTDALRIYPVPAHDRVTIEGLVQGTAVQLFSADGRLISTTRSTSNVHQVDVHGLAPGAYVLTVEQDGARVHRRVVVE